MAGAGQYDADRVLGQAWANGIKEASIGVTLRGKSAASAAKILAILKLRDRARRYNEDMIRLDRHAVVRFGHRHVVQRARIPGNMLLRPAEDAGPRRTPARCRPASFEELAECLYASSGGADGNEAEWDITPDDKAAGTGGAASFWISRRCCYRACRKHSHITIIRENWPQRESSLPLSQPRMLVAAKSAEVPAMVIEVAAVAASRGFDQILITILLSRPPLLSGMPLSRG